MSDPNLTIDDLNALPDRMRAHAAAKAVGMTSKEFLAAMSGIGVEIKSAQSGVTRDVLLTWFEGREQGAGAAAPAVESPEAEKAPASEAPARKASAAKSAGTKTPAKKAPARKTTRAQAPAGEPAANPTADAANKDSDDTGAAVVAGAESTPDQTAADQGQSTEAVAEKAPTAETAADQGQSTETAAKKAPARKRTPRKTAAQRAAEAAATDEKAEEQTPGQSGDQGASADTAPAESGPKSRPELPEIAIVTGEVGSAESGSRRRRSTASPSYSPLFLSPDAAAETTRDTTTGSRSSAGGASTDTSSEDPGEDTSHDGDRHEDDQSGQGDGAGRRRRRGRRGRGRGRGEGNDDQLADGGENDESDDDTGVAATSRDSATGPDHSGSTGSDGSSGHASGAGGDSGDQSDSDDESSDDDSDGSSSTPSGSRRRRRRRRRSGGSGSGSDDSQGTNDDPTDTEIHARDPRRRTSRGGQGASTSTSVDEVQGITGSTRLEAKRQRRRDGREAGRRRQPILSESEFLARREAVDRVMVVREKARVDGKGLMTQVGVLEDKVLVEHFVTTESARSMVGNVYLGRVQNVLPSMEAAFIDIGRGRNGVLYAGEVNWEAAGLGGKARRIEQALKPGGMVLVQVTKDPVGQKGARLSTQISLAGRFLVYVPDGNSAGISRKLPDTERRRLKAILKDVVPEGSGVIIRTAAEGVSEEEIRRDIDRLASQWTEISEATAKRKSSGAGNPVALYEEPDLLVKVVRDLFNEDFAKLVIQGETSWNTVHEYVARVAPEMVERLERYDNPEIDVFATHRVDEQLAKALDRKVWLPSGGSLVIDRTEAMTVVDVNTGKYTGSGGNLEETVTKNNLEAAEEIVRQLRLRDIGGMVIIDFIDMVLEANRDLVLRRLTEALGRDRTRHQVSEVTSLGLVQLTRKKLGTGLVEAFSTPCEHCQGRGLIVHADPVHTESHNADEPGSRRGGRRRGGKGGESSSSSSDSAASKQSPRKDGPAPSAHPAALAMGRQGTDEGEKGATGTEGGDTSPAATVPTTAPTTATPEAVAPAPEAAASAPEVVARSTSPAAEPAAAPAAASGADVETAGGSSDAAGTNRPNRRRRATRKAPSVAGDTSTAEIAETPKAESSAGAEADTSVEETAPARGGAADTPAETTDQPARRPRRRSSRREAGAAVADATPQAATEAPAVKVEAASLAEVPTAVVAEPRRRPARRRATRSTTASESD